MDGHLSILSQQTYEVTRSLRRLRVDFAPPFASKANVVAYDRHVLFTSDDPANATRHRAPSPISTTRLDEALVHEMPEQLVGLVFTQADALTYACDLGVGVYLASHLPSRSLIALSIALRWWLANSVGTTLPFRSSRRLPGGYQI